MEITTMAATKKAAGPKALSQAEIDKLSEHFAENNSTPTGYAFDPHNAQQPFRRLNAKEQAEADRDAAKVAAVLGEQADADAEQQSGS
jgi:hypothetical protein